MGASLLFGLYICLSIGCGLTADSCSLNEFYKCAYHVGNMESPHNRHKVCEVIDYAVYCLESLWDYCDYECSAQYKTQEYADLECTVHSKLYHGPMNDTADPCQIVAQLKKCNDYHCPNGDHYPKTLPVGFSPDLGTMDFTFDEGRELSKHKRCTDYAMKKYLERAAKESKSNILDCKHCTEIKLNRQHFLNSLGESTVLRTMCEGSTLQNLMVDIMKVGTKHYIQQCDSVSCEASTLSTPLVTICLLATAFLFSR